MAGENREGASPPAVERRDLAAAQPDNVVRLDAYRRARAAQAAPAIGANEERALKRKWIGRALRITDIAKAADRPATWGRAARLLDHIVNTHLDSDIIHDLAAECALLAITEESA